MSLRSKVIRLAHQKPELRKHLLPLVTKTAGFQYSVSSRDVKSIMKKLDGELGNLNYNGRLYFKFEGQE